MDNDNPFALDEFEDSPPAEVPPVESPPAPAEAPLGPEEPSTSAADPEQLEAVQEAETADHKAEMAEAEDTLKELEAEEKPKKKKRKKEADSDFLAVLQKFSWGLLKSLGTVILLLLLLWMIWTGGTRSAKDRENAPPEPPPVAEETPLEEPEKPGFFARWRARRAENKEQKAAENATQEAPQEGEKAEETAVKPESETPAKTGYTNPFDREITTEEFFGKGANRPRPSGLTPEEIMDLQPQKTPTEPSAQGLVSPVITLHETPWEGLGALPGGSVEAGMKWINAADNLFSVPLRTYITGETVATRRAKITQLLAFLKDMEGSAVGLGQTLSAEFDAFSAQANASQQTARNLQTTVNDIIRTPQPRTVGSVLEAHIAAKNEAYSASAQAEARRVIAQRINAYREAITAVIGNIAANRPALEQNIQVVGFENDPFRRVLSPAQWRARTQ